MQWECSKATLRCPEMKGCEIGMLGLDRVTASGIEVVGLLLLCTETGDCVCAWEEPC